MGKVIDGIGIVGIDILGILNLGNLIVGEAILGNATLPKLKLSTDSALNVIQVVGGYLIYLLLTYVTGTISIFIYILII